MRLNDSSRTWPELPEAGELVRLPLPLPSQLIDAAGYHGAARYVALFWTPYGDELMLSAAAVTRTGWWPAWTTLAHHPIGRAILGPYTLGSSDGEAVHWLLADRHARTLDVGAELDVRQFLATQPSELSAAAAVLGADRLHGLLLERSHRPPSAAQAHARLDRSQAQVEELRTWLDRLLEATLDREGGKR